MTDDADIAALVRNLGAHGSSVKYVHDHVGVNARLDAVQATVLRAKLRRLDDWNDGAPRGGRPLRASCSATSTAVRPAVGPRRQRGRLAPLRRAGRRA